MKVGELAAVLARIRDQDNLVCVMSRGGMFHVDTIDKRPCGGRSFLRLEGSAALWYDPEPEFKLRGLGPRKEPPDWKAIAGHLAERLSHNERCPERHRPPRPDVCPFCDDHAALAEYATALRETGR